MSEIGIVALMIRRGSRRRPGPICSRVSSKILAAGEDLSIPGIEVSLNRFGTGNPANWSKAEWRVLDNFQKMFLRQQIEQNRDNLDDTLCMFRLAGWPLEGLLDQVASAPGATLALRLWNDWCRWPAPGNESIWITAFWASPDNSTVLDFYTSRRLYEKIEALALADDTDGEVAAKASADASVIEAYANWPLKPA